MVENRIFGILLTTLTVDKLQYEEELERLLNLNVNTNKKVKSIKKLLVKISEIELSIQKVNHYIQAMNAKPKIKKQL